MSSIVKIKQVGLCTLSAVCIAATATACQWFTAPDVGDTSLATTATTVPSTAETTLPTTVATTAPTLPPVSGYGWCNATTLHIRSGPGTDYSAIGGLAYGEKVAILDKEGDWYKISLHNTVGYVSAQFIQGTEPAPMTAAPTTATTAE